MNFQRATEIINSPAMINVNYRGIRVYLKSVHSKEKKVTIFPLDNMNDEHLVRPDELSEEGPSTH